MIDLDAWMIDPHALSHDTRPIGFVDLDRCRVEAVALPPWPVVGIGDPAHPLAVRLDAVCETPVTPAMLAAGALRSPEAATIVTQLLRAIEGVEPTRALTLESLAYATLQGGAEHRAWLAGNDAVRAPAGRVHLERSGEVLAITLDRPGSRNAIDAVMRDALHEAFTVAALDPAIARVTLRAQGRAFCLGGDLAEFGTTRDPAAAHLIRTATLPAHPLARIAGKAEAYVQGACVGAGLEMAAFARDVTAGARAWFQLPELAMGLIPGAGGCVSVPRRIGRSRALLMILSGRRIDAATALRWGLVDRIVDEPAADPGRRDAHGGEIAAR